MAREDRVRQRNRGANQQSALRAPALKATIRASNFSLLHCGHRGGALLIDFLSHFNTPYASPADVLERLVWHEDELSARPVNPKRVALHHEENAVGGVDVPCHLLVTGH